MQTAPPALVAPRVAGPVAHACGRSALGAQEEEEAAGVGFSQASEYTQDELPMPSYGAKGRKRAI